jgi:hypothetical protein
LEAGIVLVSTKRRDWGKVKEVESKYESKGCGMPSRSRGARMQEAEDKGRGGKKQTKKIRK